VNWNDYISQLDKINTTKRFDFNSPVKEGSLKELKSQFNLSELPIELEELYTQTNGINEMLRDQKIGDLVWSIDRVIEVNREYRNHLGFRELYMSFDQLLFITDAGNGDLFGFVTLNGKFDRNDIFVWNHEDDSRTWIAPNLTKFIEWWLGGKIKI
jgi:hypothetical protein